MIWVVVASTSWECASQLNLRLKEITVSATTKTQAPVLNHHQV